jgi:uncharacterized Rossmann fold enzyme
MAGLRLQQASKFLILRSWFRASFSIYSRTSIVRAPINLASKKKNKIKIKNLNCAETLVEFLEQEIDSKF